jgi:transposase-like protein
MSLLRSNLVLRRRGGTGSKCHQGGEAAMKLLNLVLNRAVEEWKRPPREWCEAKTQFAILFGDRFVV